MDKLIYGEKLRVGLLVHDPMRLAGLSSICAALPNIEPVRGDLTTLLADESIQFIVIDFGSSMGKGRQNIDLIRRIQSSRPELNQIVMGQADDDLVIEAILAGARAYLDMNASPLTISKAFEEVQNGTIWARRIVLSSVIDRLMKSQTDGLPVGARNAAARLTSREHQVVELILQARSNREIAAQLGIEERTVKAHLGHLMRKVGVNNRIELSVWALKQGNVL